MNKVVKIAIVTSHPIQYNAPLFALLAEEPKIDIMVFYTWGGESMGAKFDLDFGKKIEWDIPLLEGYNFKFVKNISKHPGTHHFKGIINPFLNREIEDWKPDVVWIWGWAFHSHLKAIRYFKGKVPVWFRGDSTLLDEPKGFSLKKIARRFFLKWLYRHIDKAFYVGKNNREYFKKHGILNSQLVYAPHAVDNVRFADPKGKFLFESKQLRKKLGYSESDLVLMYIGKFEPNKNLKSLIYNLNDTKFKLILVGNGPLEKKLKSISASNVQFLEFQNQSKLPIVYRIADAVILNSISETWGLVLNEALACGIPVFASNKCGGAIDLINERNGFIFDSLEMNKDELIKFLSLFQKTDKQETLLEGHNYQIIIDNVLKEILDSSEFSSPKISIVSVVD